MHAIAGTDDPDALARRPPEEVLKIEIPAGGSRNLSETRRVIRLVGTKIARDHSGLPAVTSRVLASYVVVTNFVMAGSGNGSKPAMATPV